MFPSSDRTTATAVGRLCYGIPIFTDEPQQFEATTIKRTQHPRVLHDDQDQRAAHIFRDVETDRRAHDDRVRGTPSFTGPSQSRTATCTILSARAAASHKPVVNPSAVAQGPSTTPSPRSSGAAEGTKRCVCWAVRTRSSVKEQCSLRLRGMMKPVVIRRYVARSLRNCCEEVTGGTSLCMKPSKWHERWLEVVARATRSATNMRRWNSRARALCLDELVVKKTKVGARNPTQQP